MSAGLPPRTPPSSKIKELQAKFSGKGGTQTPVSYSSNIKQQQDKDRIARDHAQRMRERKLTLVNDSDRAGKLQARKRRSTVTGISIPELTQDEMTKEAAFGLESGHSGVGQVTAVSDDAGKQVEAFFRRKSFVTSLKQTAAQPMTFDDDDDAEDVYGSLLPTPASKTTSSSENVNVVRLQSDTNKSYFIRLTGYLKDPSLRSMHAICVEMIRNELSKRKPPIDEAIEAGLVPIMIEYLKYGTEDGQIFESAWVLTNISCEKKEHTAVVVEAGAIPLLVKHQSSKNHLIIWQTAWVLGNIAGESREFRDMVLRAKGLEAVIATLSVSKYLNLVRNAAWTISNIFRWKPLPELSCVDASLPRLCELIHHEDQDVQVDALWALSHIAQGESECKQRIVGCKLHQDLVHGLESGVVNLIMPSLRIIHSLVTFSLDEVLRFIRDDKLLDRLQPILANYALSARCTNMALQVISAIADKLSSAESASSEVEACHAMLHSSRIVIASSKLLSNKENANDSLWLVYALTSTANRWVASDSGHLVRDAGVIPRLFHIIGTQFHSNHSKSFYPKVFSDSELLAGDCLVNLTRVGAVRDQSIAIAKQCIQLDDTAWRIRKRSNEIVRILLAACLRKTGKSALSLSVMCTIFSFSGDLGAQILMVKEIFQN